MEERRLLFYYKSWNYELVISDCNVLNYKYEFTETRTRMRQFLAEERYVSGCLNYCNDRLVKDESVEENRSAKEATGC